MHLRDGIARGAGVVGAGESEERRPWDALPTHHPSRAGKAGHHRWLMIACCIPMLLIAVAPVATGVVGVGFIAIAVACTVMMAIMMGGMSHGGGGRPQVRARARVQRIAPRAALRRGGWTSRLDGSSVCRVAVAGLAITWLFASSRDGSSADGGPSRHTPERLLDERLVRGELDERLREALAGR